MITYISLINFKKRFFSKSYLHIYFLIIIIFFSKDRKVKNINIKLF